MAGATLLGGLAQPARLEWRAARLVEALAETPRVRTLVLDVRDWPGHHAGQHLDLRLTAEDGYQAQRSYSIASPPGGSRVEVTVERLSDGEVSPYLTDVMREGDLVEIKGPIGGYFVWIPESNRPLALLAGGSGVVPLMSMLRHRALLAADSTTAVPPARLLYSVRSAEDLIYRAELDRLAAMDPNLRVAYTLTRSQPAGWSGYRRRLDRKMLEEVFWPPDAAAVFYVCGPSPMVEAGAHRPTATLLTSPESGTPAAGPPIREGEPQAPRARQPGTIHTRAAQPAVGANTVAPPGRSRGSDNATSHPYRARTVATVGGRISR